MEQAASLFLSKPNWVFLEDFLLHARNVRDLLWERWQPEARFAESAVLAEYYVPDITHWRTIRGAKPAIVRESDKPIDKQLSHITRERADPSTFRSLEQIVEPLRAAILTQWNRFLEQLTGSEWRAPFDAAIAEKRRALQ